MQAFGRPRAAAIVPFTAVAAAAALFLLIAVSVALQPPDTSRTGLVGGALAWARTLLFLGGALAFVVCVAAFARAGDGQHAAEDFREGKYEREDAGAGDPDTPPDMPQAEEAAMRFTLIALGGEGHEARAIADFDDPRALLAALNTWRWQHPDEELRVFGPDGTPIARRLPLHRPEEAEAEPAPALPALRRMCRPGLAIGGAS